MTVEGSILILVSFPLAFSLIAALENICLFYTSFVFFILRIHYPFTTGWPSPPFLYYIDWFWNKAWDQFELYWHENVCKLNDMRKKKIMMFLFINEFGSVLCLMYFT